MSNKLMVIQQLPVIQERLITARREFENITSDALALVCNEDTYKTVKDKRAEITARFKEFESDRIAIKKAILEPYDALEAVYNECVKSTYEKAKEELDKKISDVENGIKSVKECEVKRYFEEYKAACHIDFVEFEDTGIRITMSASAKKLKEQSKSYIDDIVSDIALIKTQPEELQAEMMIEYEDCLDINRAIGEVIERHRRIENEHQKGKPDCETGANVAEPSPSKPLAPPTEEKTEVVHKMTFTVSGTISQLKSLKEYIVNNGIQITD